jgi:hypothetical protein
VIQVSYPGTHSPQENIKNGLRAGSANSFAWRRDLHESLRPEPFPGDSTQQCRKGKDRSVDLTAWVSERTAAA